MLLTSIALGVAMFLGEAVWRSSMTRVRLRSNVPQPRRKTQPCLSSACQQPLAGVDLRSIVPPGMLAPWLRSLVLAGLWLAALWPCTATAATRGAGSRLSTGRHCAGSADPKLVMSEMVVGQSNPLGVENDITAGACMPLILEPGVLFDYTNVQAGLLLYLNPVSVQQGGYVSITPLSILELHAEAAWVLLWPLPIDGAGYFPLTGYDASYRESDLPASKEGSAHGFTISTRATLQGKVDVASRLHLLAQDAFAWEYWRMGNAPFYYNIRNGVALARSDYLLLNRASLLAQIDLSDSLELKLGANDELTLVPNGSYAKNIVGGIAILTKRAWPTPDSEVGPFLRLGAYTAHPCRTGLQVFGGLYWTFEVARWERH